jgi:hypothetical protein
MVVKFFLADIGVRDSRGKHVRSVSTLVKRTALIFPSACKTKSIIVPVALTLTTPALVRILERVVEGLNLTNLSKSLQI